MAIKIYPEGHPEQAIRVDGRGSGLSNAAIVTEEEWELLPDEKKNSGIYVIEGEGGSSSGGGSSTAVSADEVAFDSKGTWIDADNVQDAIEELIIAYKELKDKLENSGGEVEPPTPDADTYTISVSAYPDIGGTVSGGGTFKKDASTTVKADAANNYSFENWTESGAQVSNSANYTFSVENNRNLIANFKEKAPIYEAGVDWHPAVLPSTASWNSVAYGNGRFVAIATSNSDTAAYSDDGEIWKPSSLPSASNWNGVAYGNNKFVAIASGTIAAYSEDGENWKKSNALPYSANWVNVAFGNGTFVVVDNTSGSTRVAYSQDGITWYGSTMPSQNSWLAVAYGGGKFVAMNHDSGTNVAYSLDGKTWKSGDALPFSNVNWSSVAYGNNQFIATSISSNKLVYSKNGISWSGMDLPTGMEFAKIVYGGDKFIALQDDSDEAAYSEDGSNWETTTLPYSGSWSSAIYGDGKFVAVAYYNNKAIYSYTGN